jgi:hypothetical protein
MLSVPVGQRIGDFEPFTLDSGHPGHGIAVQGEDDGVPEGEDPRPVQIRALTATSLSLLSWGEESFPVDHIAP